MIQNHPEVVERLKAEYDRWNAEMSPAQWSWVPAYGGNIRIPADDPHRQWQRWFNKLPKMRLDGCMRLHP